MSRKKKRLKLPMNFDDGIIEEFITFKLFKISIKIRDGQNHSQNHLDPDQDQSSGFF